MNLTTENILTIIKECKGSVKSIKITARTIEVDFIVPHQPISELPSTHHQGQDPRFEIEIADEKNLVKDLSDGKTQEEVDQELLIDELAIIDPSAMEDLIAMKEVVSVEEKNH